MKGQETAIVTIETFVTFYLLELLEKNRSSDGTKIITKKLSSEREKYVKAPEETFAYEFFNTSYFDTPIGNELVRHKSISRHGVSARHYIGNLYSLEKFKKEFPNGYITYWETGDMRKFTQVIQCFTGHWVPFYKGDTLHTCKDLLH